MAATDDRAARAARLTGLYAVTPDVDDTAALVAKCAAAIDGGARAIQYRHKTASDALREAQARAIVALCRERGALSIVNDDAALAERVGADGVHVGEEDGSVASARAIVGPARIVGASCYDALPRAVDAVAEGAGAEGGGPEQGLLGHRSASVSDTWLCLPAANRGQGRA